MAGVKSKSNGMRKRGKDRSKVWSETTKPATAKDGVDDQRTNETTTTPAPSQSPLSSLWDRLMEFKPLIGITLLVMVPYALHNAYLFVYLQRPEWLAVVESSLSAYGLLPLVSSLIKMVWILRPSFEASDVRQVLVVGTMSSGTTQVAHDLSTTLGLEIGHENSETRWSFVRDGTISWFHGIRFLTRPGIDDPSASVDLVLPLPPANQPPNPNGDEQETTTTTIVTLEGERLFRYLVNLICRELHPNMGFHPFMFRDNGRCSLRQSWGTCWKEECKNLLEQEWGCALGQDPSSSPSSCITPYHKTLHQVRNPLKTVESLVTKFCIGGVDGDLQPSFAIFAKALFPQHDFSSLSCIEASGYYIYEYNTAILGATQRGYIDAIFQVEEATPCKVARLAGFLGDDANDNNIDETYQQRIRDNLVDLCSDDTTSADAADDNTSEANQPMVSTKNKYNKGQLSLDWDDLLGGRHGSQKEQGDRDLQQRLKQMATKLGYR
jgi:hypothetical protein